MLFVLVVAVSCEDENHDFSVVNLIDKSVLLGDATTPLSVTFACQWLWMTRACTGMLHQLVKKLA